MIIKKVTEIPVDIIEVNPDQPRRIFGEDELMELTESVKKYGVIQPVIVKKNETGTYTLIAGERRQVFCRYNVIVASPQGISVQTHYVNIFFA